MKKRVCVVVMGDIGRSPRMQYHGMSLAEEDYQVTFVGYDGSKPVSPLINNKNVHFLHVYRCPDFKNDLPTVLAYAFKALWQIVTLLWALFSSGVSDYIIFQNPPAVPALAVCYMYCKLIRCKLIIDWHNYGYSLLALSLGPTHTLVKLSKRLEFYFGRKADHNLCVTNAMREDLSNHHSIEAITFYDKPPDFFQRTPLSERHKLFLKLGIEYSLFLDGCNRNETVFTRVTDTSEIILREDRPGLLVSSTSWTEDEDFSILLSALDDYEKAKNECGNLPRLICAITGKGPLKDFYLGIIEKKKWKHVEVITPWLETKEYPLFLGSADLGVCLHKSSSGLDLPMKVVDMFGCGVPVCAINFLCLPELVRHGKNGYIFNDDKELSAQMQDWFRGFPEKGLSKEQVFQKNLQKFQMDRWHANWKSSVQPLIV